MKKYIELDSAINEMARFKGYLDDDMILRLQIALKKITTADVVSVVRCKDCKWFRTEGDSNWCAITGMEWEDEKGFCHEAEKKVTECTE